MRLGKGSTDRPLALGGVLAALVVALVMLVLAPAASAAPAAPPGLPILFVHGVEGTGAQFESQALRFTSNGYPASWIDEVDYNSTTAAGDQTQVDAQIDQKIAELEQRTGAKQVDVVAHSLGTFVMYDYLTSGPMAAQRRANVARYVNVDGQNSNPGVPTLALWAGIPIGQSSDQPATGSRHMDGAQNVLIPHQTHVETCTSWESFVPMFQFFAGHPPLHDIIRQQGSIQLAGRALAFPQNTGLSGTTVQVWPLTANGQRMAASPLASMQVTDGSQGGGAWGPVTVQAGQRYEFALVRTGAPTLHIYYEPFIRSDYTLRLLDSDALTTYTGYRPGSVSVVNIRYKEFWGDQPGQSDDLKINGLSICTPSLCPTSKTVNAYFAFDDNRDGKTELTADPTLSNVPFLTGSDVFMPASTPPSGNVTFQLRSRGAGSVRTVMTPNWDSLHDGVIVQWNDYEPSEVQTPGTQCPAATGSLSGRRLGLLRLGMTRTQARRAFSNSSDRGRRYEDFFCLTPIGVRVGYASPKLLRGLPVGQRRGYRNRVVWASTANPFYSLRGIRPGSSLRAARQRLRLSRGYHVGLNWWYFAPNGSATALLKVRHGVVEEIGIANRSLSRGRRGQGRFVTSFS
jgi:pimeloyl-ACP methyl ester carboxylesterase